MSYPEIFLLALGLSVDTFVVSLSGGVCSGKINFAKMVGIATVFALFQTGFTFVGWFLGYSVIDLISEIDHWIAFALLCYIGGRMIYSSVKEKDDAKCINLSDTRTLVMASVATSIDALAVGISFAMLSLPGIKFITALILILIITAIASIIGLFSGNRVGALFGKRSEIAGGAVLIIIGIKILVEHLFFQ